MVTVCQAKVKNDETASLWCGAVIVVETKLSHQNKRAIFMKTLSQI
jgi:hypothetical protein